MFPKCLRLTALLVALASTAAAAPLAAQQPVPGYEQGLFELATHGLEPGVLLSLVDSAGHTFLPLHPVLQATGLLQQERDSILVVPQIDGSTARFDLRRGRLTNGRDTITFGTTDLVKTAAEAYLSPAALGRLVQAEVTVDMSSLAIVLRREVPFPAAKAEVIERRRMVLEAAARYREQQRLRASTPYRPVTGFGILDWDLSTNGLDPRDGVFFSGRGGAAVWGGSLTASGMFRGGGALASRVTDRLLSYHRVFPRSSLIRQLTVGDLVSDGTVERPLRGITLSNLPEEPGTETGQTLVRPDLPAGWQYEVFQSGRLIGYSDVGGAVPVALLPGGITPVYVRMYGPAGQEVTREFYLHAPTSLLPPGRFEYAAGSGQCRDGQCRNLTYAEIRYGFGRGITLGTGARALTDTVHTRVRPTFAASFTTGQVMAGEFSTIPGELLRGSLAIHRQETTRAMVSGEISTTSLGAISPFATPDRQWTVGQTLDQRTSRSLLGLQTIRLHSTFSGTSTTGLQHWAGGLTATRGGSYTDLEYQNGTFVHGLVNLRTSVLFPVAWLTRLGSVFNTTVGANAGGLQILEAGVSIRPRPLSTVNVSGRWTREDRRPTLNVGVSAVLSNAVQSVARMTSSRHAKVAATFGISGAAAFDPGKVDLSPLSRVGYGGIHGVLFRDLDGDGVFGPGDIPVPGINVLVGARRAVTDSVGRYHVWTLRPYELASVAPDTTTSPDPSWTAGRSATIIRPAPNTSLRVDIPLVQTRELSGSIVAATGVATAAGVTIDVRNVETGETISAVTFSDGEYYVSRIRPGRYTLRVAPSSLQALQAQASPDSLEFTVPAAGDDILVELPPVTLSRVRP